MFVPYRDTFERPTISPTEPPQVRIVPGTAYEGECAYATIERPPHGTCLRMTKPLHAGRSIFRVIDRAISRDGCIWETSAAFRDRRHAEAWYNAITKEQ